jgi:hypothetical protein
MWEKFFERVSLIDNFELKCNTQRKVEATVRLLPLGQYRKVGFVQGEKYEINWYQNGRERQDLEGLLVPELDAVKDKGKWSVKVALTSPEIRKKGIATKEMKFDVTPNLC